MTSNDKNSHDFAALVTGSSSGIGLGITRYFLEQNAVVYGLSRRGTEIVNGKFCDMVCDVRHEQQVEEVLQEVLAADIPLETVVLNAGVLHLDPLSETGHKNFMEMIETNVMGVFYFLKHLHGVIAEETGHIIVVGSQAAGKGINQLGTYGATKAALKPMIDEARDEFKASGVRITLLQPGAVDTQLWSDYSLTTEEQNMLSVDDLVDVVDFINRSPPHVQWNEINLQHYLGLKT